MRLMHLMMFRGPAAAWGLAVVLLLGGCASSGGGAAAPGPTTTGPTRSRALTGALAMAIHASVRDQASQHGRVPQLSGGSEIETLIAELSLRYPTVLRTTPEQEQRLREGRVDYAQRMNELRAISRRIEREEIALPIVSTWLLGQFREGALVGAQLELAGRLLAAQLEDPHFVAAPERDG